MTKIKTLVEPSATDKIPVLVAFHDFVLFARGFENGNNLAFAHY